MPKKNETPLMETRDLKKSYFSSAGLETEVLFDVDLKINSGEFVSIMGPSGSGKSTLMHILGFLDVPTSGSYLFDGEDVSGFSDNELAEIRGTRVGFDFQSFNLLPRTTVLQNVILPLMYNNDHSSAERVEMAHAAIDQVGLSDRAKYLTNQLSGGQQQRVAIARALVTQPDIIFADEPTGNLDSQSGMQVMSILQDLNEEGHTIILVTHEKQTAMHSERILHILDGCIDSDKSDFKRVKAKDLSSLK